MDRLPVSSEKSAWKEKPKRTWNFFCPVCGAACALPFKPEPGSLRHYAQVLISALFFTCLTWKWFAFKGLVSFLPIWIGFELFYRTRVRASATCTSCGFDPFLYLVDVQKTRAEIENHWRKKFAERGIPYPEPKSKISARGAKKSSAASTEQNKNATS